MLAITATAVIDRSVCHTVPRNRLHLARDSFCCFWLPFAENPTYGRPFASQRGAFSNGPSIGASALCSIENTLA
jgi:hypothetical protein